MKRVTYWPQAVLGASSHPASQHATTASHHLPRLHSTPPLLLPYPTLPYHPPLLHPRTYIHTKLPNSRSTHSRSRLQLGRAPRLVRRLRRGTLARSRSTIRRRRALDAGIRQHLRTPGQSGRRARRHPLNGAALRRAHALHPRRLLRLLGRLHRARGPPQRPRRAVLPRDWPRCHAARAYRVQDGL